MKIHTLLYRISILTLVLIVSIALYFVVSIIRSDFTLSNPLSVGESIVVRGTSQTLQLDYCTNVKASINYQLIDGQIINLAQETSVSGCGSDKKTILMPLTVNGGQYKLRVVATYKVLWVTFKREYDTVYFTVK